jgi:hypothetical protein
VLRSREPDVVEADESLLHGLARLEQSCYEPFGTIVTERGSGILFVAGNLIEHHKLRLAAELAKRDDSLLIGLTPGLYLSKLGTSENLRLMHRFCDTIIIIDPIKKQPNSGPERLRYSDVAFEIYKGLTNVSCRRLLRSMLKRGQLARASSARSTSNVEEALLRAVRTLLPVADFSRKPEVFLSISGRKIERKTLARVSKWISNTLYPSNTIICYTYSGSEANTSVFLAATGIAFPYSPSARRLSMDLDELEPESDGDNEMAIALGLDQME